MKRNTLLDFLTHRAEPRAAQEFQRVLADAKADEQMAQKWKDQSGWTDPSGKPLDPKTIQGLETLFRVLYKDKSPDAAKKFYKETEKPLKSLLPQTDSQKFSEFMKKTADSKGGNLWNDFAKLFKGKDPFDMTPSDIENLFKVYRDPHGKVGEWDVVVSPEYLQVPNQTVDNIAGIVARFYKDNQAFFTSADDVKYDKDKKLLSFKGSDMKFEELLDKLRLKSDIRANILQQKRDMEGIWFIPFTPKIEPKGGWKTDEEAKAVEVPPFEDWAMDDEYQAGGSAIFKKFQDEVDRRCEEAAREGWINKDSWKWVQDKGQMFLQFKGSLGDLKQIFSSSETHSKPAWSDVTHFITTLKSKRSQYMKVGI